MPYILTIQVEMNKIGDGGTLSLKTGSEVNTKLPVILILCSTYY